MKFKIILISTMLLLLGCSLINGPSKPKFQNYKYPLEIGNSWTYEKTFTFSKIIPDTVQLPNGLVQKGSAFIEVTAIDTISDSLEAYILSTIAIDSFHPEIEHPGSFLFTNEEDGLYEQANSGNSFAMPISRPPTSNEFRRFLFDNEKIFESKILLSNSNSAQSLKYPINSGSEWLYRHMPEFSSISKKITGYEELQFNGKKYDCFVVEWIYSFETTLTVTDYYSIIGLMKRTIIIKNMRVSSYANIDLARADITDEYVLVEFTQGQ